MRDGLWSMAAWAALRNSSESIGVFGGVVVVELMNRRVVNAGDEFVEAIARLADLRNLIEMDRLSYPTLTRTRGRPSTYLLPAAIPDRGRKVVPGVHKVARWRTFRWCLVVSGGAKWGDATATVPRFSESRRPSKATLHPAPRRICFPN